MVKVRIGLIHVHIEALCGESEDRVDTCSHTGTVYGESETHIIEKDALQIKALFS